jgi:hypothetical protein
MSRGKLPLQEIKSYAMKIIPIPLLFLFFVQSHAAYPDTIKQVKSNCSDSSFFDGYYVVLYTKAEVDSLEKNRERKMEGKSYQVPFESSMLRFFISKDSMARRSFAAIIDDLPKKDKRQVFIECTQDYADALGEEFCGKKSGTLKCAWPELPSSNKYFTASRQSRYCFKIYEISGWFLKLRVNTEEKRDAIGKKIRYVDPRLKEFDAYFFVGYKTYSGEAASLGDKIQLWKEVPPIFE